MLSPYAQQTMVDLLPIAACVFTGPDHLISAANEQMLAIWNKDASAIGRSLQEGVPEIFDQGFFGLLDDVYRTGKQYRNPDGTARLVIDGQIRSFHFDFSLKPLRDRDGEIYGVVNTALDTTERVLAITQLEQTVEELAATNEELSALNEEYLALNEELEAGSEELRASNEELWETREQLQVSLRDLAHTQERLLLAADSVNLGMYDVDLEKQEIITSKRFDAIFGYEAPVDVRSYQAAIHPEDAVTRERAMAEAMTTGRLFYEARVIRPDKQVIWIRAEGKVIYSDQKQPVGIMGTVLDITAERHGQEIQRKLKTLADNSADLMSLLELDGRNSYINQAGKDLLGFVSDEEVQRTPIAALHAPEDLAFVKQEVLPSVMANGKWMGSMQVRHLKTGEVFPVLNYTIRIDDPATGKPIGIGAIMRDLRPEFASKKALADSEQMLRNVTSAAPTALWMADQQGDITYVNQTWIHWTGLSLGQNRGDGWLQAIVPEDRQLVSSVYSTALEKKNVFQIEFRILNSEGQLRWFSASGQPQLDSDGQFSGFVGACIDITSQKELQQHKDDFISIASHELKTPITSLKASVQLLNKMKITSDNPMVPKLLVQAGKGVERVSTLIEDLLNVSRLQQQQLQLNKNAFILSELLNACANPIALAGKQRIVIKGDLETEVFADEHRIDQVVTNLLTNAVKYAPESEVIELEVTKLGTHVKVSVSDQGPGIPKDRLKNLFDRYYRVDEIVQYASGLGLGLYISAEIIHRHGGEINVESEIGKGSTFWFKLPLNA